MADQFSRTELLFGKEAMEKLASCRIAVFGLGGVGGHTSEALARSGVGALDLIDNDKISLSNINRQIFATRKTLGQYKTDAAEDRLLSINPEIKITKHNIFFVPENADSLDFSRYDYVIDAIDTVAGKIAIIEKAKAAQIPVISSMGAGNKLDPTAFEVADIYETSVCPLARVLRHELKKRGIESLKVVYSRERAMTPEKSDEEQTNGRRQIPGSTAFVPPVAGLIIAAEVIKDITGVRNPI